MACLAFRRNIDQIVVLSRVIPVNTFKSSQKLLSARHDPAGLQKYGAEEERPMLAFASAMVR
jgi:hypothetical protein